MNQSRFYSSFSKGIAAILVASSVGCAGSAVDGTASGQATMSITWPERTRVIPVAANSITVTFWKGTTVVSTKTVARPTVGNQSTVSFTSLASGTYTVVAQAFPNANGTGTAQASASQSVTISSGTTTPLEITMASTIATLTATMTTAGILVGASAPITVTAIDANGATVLTSASTITYGSSNTSVATVDSSGVVTGVATGTATITVTETESGVTGTIDVNVMPAI